MSSAHSLFTPSRRSVLGMFLGSGVALHLPASAFAQGAARELTIAMAGMNATHGAYDQSNFSARVTQNLYDTLIRRDFRSGPGGSGAAIEPGLATSWKMLTPTTWELKIRQGVKFHDGSAMSAEDVAFTLSPERQAIRPNSLIGPITGAEVVDAETVVVTTSAFDPAFEMRLTTQIGRVVPAALYRELGHPGFANTPVGTGPYFVDSQSEDSITLKPFADYWDGLAPLDKITYRAVPETATRIAGLITGEFDIVTSIPPAQMELIEAEEHLAVQASVAENIHLLLLQSIADLREDPASAVLADKRMRQALVHALDRQLIIDTLWKGLTVVPTGFSFPEYGDLHVPKTPRAYDPERAMALIAEAGYDGRPLTIALVGGYYVNMDRAVEIMAEMWKAVGLNVQIEVRENGEQLDPRNQWDASAMSSNFNVPDPNSPMWDYWGAPTGTHYRKEMWKPTERFSELGEILTTSQDRNARREAFSELLDIWEDEVPALLLYRPVEVYGLRKGIEWQSFGNYGMDFRADNILL